MVPAKDFGWFLKPTHFSVRTLKKSNQLSFIIEGRHFLLNGIITLFFYKTSESCDYQQVLRCSKLIQIKPKISWGPFTCLWNLCGSRRVVLSFGDSRGRKFERGDNIKVVIGSQWIWTILRPHWSSQLGKEDSITSPSSTFLFAAFYVASIHKSDMFQQTAFNMLLL